MPSRETTTSVSIVNVIRPVMQLRAGLDRVSTLILRKKMGFGVSQFRILYVLAYKPHITQKDIADFWDVTEASVSRQMSILEKRGFIRRNANGKREKSRPAISPAGKAALDRALKYTTESFEKIFKDISPGDRKTAVELLEKLLEKVKISQPHTT